MTTQEITKIAEDKERVKQEFLKKSKKKKWTAEDEKAALDQVNQKSQDKLKEIIWNKL